MTTLDIRPSPIAGTWYSGDADQLAREVDNYLELATAPELEGEVVALIAPHAGHIYSGKTAGHAFQCVRGKIYELVVIVSPYHAYHPAPFLTSAHQAYSTPLGNVVIDRSAVDELHESMMANYREGMTPIINDQEHSLEIEIPFLQRALAGKFKLLPIMVRTYEVKALRALGRGLAEVVRERQALLVASTDLSHFYPEAVAHGLDAEMLRQMAGLSPEGVLEAEQTGKGFACGAGGVVAVLWAAKGLGANRAELLHYSTSAEASGDRSSVVGYGAVAVSRV